MYKIGFWGSMKCMEREGIFTQNIPVEDIPQRDEYPMDTIVEIGGNSANDALYVPVEDAENRAVKAEQLETMRNAEFERQFNEVHLFKLGEESLEYALIDPTQIQHENTNAEWVIFIGGFSSIKETYHDEMINLAHSGRRVLFVSPDKGVPPPQEGSDYFNAYAGALPDTMRNKAGALALLLDELDIKRANIIGHSQGGAVATALTGMKPGLAKRLILDNPAGLIGEDTVGKLLSRVKAEAKREPVGGQSTTTWRKQIKRLLTIPLWRATKEIPGIAHTDIRPILEDIKRKKLEQKTDTDIVLINAHGDQIFKAGDIEASLGGHPFEQYVDRWAEYIDPNMGHGKFNRDDGELFVQVMDDPRTRTSIIHQIVSEDAGVQKN